jgi:hypothetical protein
MIKAYKITESNEFINNFYGITPEINDKLDEMAIKVQKKKNSAIKELNELIKKYPFVPQFKNYLSTLYDLQGNHFMAQEISRRMVSLHPEYVYGRLSLADIAIINNELEKVPEILGKDLELNALYPERDEYHIGEVLGFLKTAFNYFIGIGNGKQAQTRLDDIVKLNKEYNFDINTFELSRRLLLLNLDDSLKKQDLEWTDDRKPKVIVKKIVEPSSVIPQFTHDIINQLYCNSLRIDQQIIAEILALPHETLLDDLHKVVYDSMARYEAFANKDWDIETQEFMMHALLLLTELKDKRSLTVFLDVLSQDKEYLEKWLSDYLTDGFWELLYAIANDKLELLYNFVIEPNGYTYSKSSISQMTQQLILHQPERKIEVISWYKRVFEFWIANNENDDIIDSDLIAFFISDVVDIQLVELIPEITALFNLNLVSKGISGNLEECLDDMNEFLTIDFKKEIFSSITERYNDFTTNWFSYNNENEEDYEEEVYDDVEEIKKQVYRDLTNSEPIPIEKPKVGRNEPCPCGSGKKYKKCCLNN